jgi:integrase
VPALPDIDLSQEVAEYLRAFSNGREGLLFETRNGTPYLHNNLESRWLTTRLVAMGLDEKGMGFHTFRRFRKTWLRGKRCEEDINNFWMGHKPRTRSELYSRMDEELEQRLQEAKTVGVGFEVPAYGAPSCSKILVEAELQLQRK